MDELFQLSEAEQEQFAELIVLLKLELLRDDIRTGLESGDPGPFDAREIIRRGQERLAAKKRTA